MKDPVLVGVKEIARRAGVSIATVDRVLNNRTGVSIQTKDKILAIIKELDYQPNIFARRLASKKRLKFAVLIPSVSDETGYWNAPLNGINQAAAEVRDYGVEIQTYFFDQNNKTTFVNRSKEILQQNFNGVLLAPMFEEESILFIKECNQKEIPFVFINSDIQGYNSLCYIGPNLYQSGFLAAHLINYLAPTDKRILIVNISKEIDLHHHLLRKEVGFRAYLAQHSKDQNISKVDIRQTDYESVKQKLAEVLDTTGVDIIFVTNSRVSSVAQYLQEKKIKDIKLIGFDFLEENIRFLESGTIDFLICQKPQEQGYKGIMALYNYLTHAAPIEKEQFMPIDIITKENYTYYSN